MEKDRTKNSMDIQKVLSKVLGFGILGGSVLYKVPQILKIISMGDVAAKEVSKASYVMEIVGFAVHLGYNFRLGNPLSTYGEVISIIVQNLVALFYLCKFSGLLFWFLNGVLIYGCVQYSLMFGGLAGFLKVDMELLSYFVSLSTIIFTAAKLPQIWALFRSRSARSISIPTLFIAVAGSAVRIYTTLQEVNDQKILQGFLLGFALNLFIFLQAIYFKNFGVQEVSDKDEKNKEKKE